MRPWTSDRLFLEGGRLRQSGAGLLVMHAANALVIRGACDGGCGLLLQSSMTKEEKNVGHVTATPEEALPTIPGAPVSHSRVLMDISCYSAAPLPVKSSADAPLPGFGH